MQFQDDPTLVAIEHAAAAQSTIRECLRIVLARHRCDLSDADYDELETAIAASWRTLDYLTAIRSLYKEYQQ